MYNYDTVNLSRLEGSRKFRKVDSNTRAEGLGGHGSLDAEVFFQFKMTLMPAGFLHV